MTVYGLLWTVPPSLSGSRSSAWSLACVELLTGWQPSHTFQCSASILSSPLSAGLCFHMYLAYQPICLVGLRPGFKFCCGSPGLALHLGTTQLASKVRALWSLHSGSSTLDSSCSSICPCGTCESLGLQLSCFSLRRLLESHPTLWEYGGLICTVSSFLELSTQFLAEFPPPNPVISLCAV